MATMALSWSNKQKAAQVFDPIRRLWVAAFPEEVVRQKFLQRMLKLGYPKAYIAVEKELKELSHLSLTQSAIPERRLDIICFAKEIHPHFMLYPLLLVECKQKLIKDNATEQLLGYNEYVRAPFLAIVDENRIEVIFKNSDGKQSLSFLPSYKELINAVRATASRS